MKKKLLMAVFVVLFCFSVFGCSFMQTAQPRTHVISMEWSGGIVEDYVLPSEIPDPVTLSKTADVSRSAPMGHFCFCGMLGVYGEDGEQNFYFYVFKPDNRVLLALYHLEILSDKTEKNVFWIYEKLNKPEQCTKDEQEQFLLERCTI